MSEQLKETKNQQYDVGMIELGHILKSVNPSLLGKIQRLGGMEKDEISEQVLVELKTKMDVNLLQAKIPRICWQRVVWREYMARSKLENRQKTWQQKLDEMKDCKLVTAANKGGAHGAIPGAGGKAARSAEATSPASSSGVRSPSSSHIQSRLNGKNAKILYQQQSGRGGRKGGGKRHRNQMTKGSPSNTPSKVLNKIKRRRTTSNGQVDIDDDEEEEEEVDFETDNEEEEDTMNDENGIDGQSQKQ